MFTKYFLGDSQITQTTINNYKYENYLSHIFSAFFNHTELEGIMDAGDRTVTTMARVLANLFIDWF